MRFIHQNEYCYTHTHTHFSLSIHDNRYAIDAGRPYIATADAPPIFARTPFTERSIQVKVTSTVFEIALVRLSETSDYLLGQVNNPLAVIRRTSSNLQQYFIVHYHFILMQS